MLRLNPLLFLALACFIQNSALATDYFVHPTLGNDQHEGTSREEAFQSLDRASMMAFAPGDRLLLASGQVFSGSLRLIGQNGKEERPIVISSTHWNSKEKFVPAVIDFRGKANGILIQNCSYVELSQISLTGNGFEKGMAQDFRMRCGLLITNKGQANSKGIELRKLHIYDVFFENEGFGRGKEEVKTANGTQRYGWGIRVINPDPMNTIRDITIKACRVENVSHTGIKLTGKRHNIREVSIEENMVHKSGGPGIQMSEVRDVHVHGNEVKYSGSADDSRKWGRGSGLWTWGSSRVLIEKNSFLYANGPGDSSGAHIDFNCDNIILQYNLSAYNAGGFCEVLGNTYNCSYRYNLSINDGHRIKGKDGAFQEGKVLWLSGYQGRKKKRKGPVNFYFYNNTIYNDGSFVARIAIDQSSRGVLIANNIFCLKAGTSYVLGDQYRPDRENGQLVENVFFSNNLFLKQNNWPGNLEFRDGAPLYGNPQFSNEEGMEIEDFRPLNETLIRGKGIPIELLPGDAKGLWQPLHPKRDILGQPIQQMDLGAVGVGK